MASLTRDQILQADDATAALQTVEVPEWGGTVHVRVMTGTQRDRWEANVTGDPGNNPRARLATYTLCDEQGKPLFTEADIISLGGKSVTALDRVLAAAMRANALGPDATEEAAKNS